VATPADIRLLLGVVIACVAAQLGLRGWALYGGWFYLDDYNLLHDAETGPLSLGRLLEPYNDHLMPGGRLLTWIVADAGTLSWPVAATIVLVCQALASSACAWMLLTLSGPRWGILVPLNLYLWSALTFPALLWWAACVNQLPYQIAFFVAVGCWTRYLRSQRLRWLAATALAVGFGLLFDVKSLLVLPVLAFLLLAYFTSGGLVVRLREVARRTWPALVVGGLLTGLYLAYYVGHADQPLSRPTASLAARLADTMLGTGFASAVVGGPWRWEHLTSPASYADPPSWTQHLAWVVIVVVLLHAWLTRRRTIRAWALLAGYLLLLYGLLVSSRALLFGPVLGLEYRYLTDAGAVLALAVALAYLPLAGAPGSSEPRDPPLLLVRVPSVAVALLVAAVSVSAAVSTVRYASIWHDENASEPYLRTLRHELAVKGTVDLADREVPDPVMSHLAAPHNTVRRLAGLASDTARFPDATSQLAVVADDGSVRQALIQPGVTSRPGPEPGCGWRIGARGRTIPLTGRAFDWTWWLRVGYLGSQASPVTVTAGRTRLETSVSGGLHSVYLRVDGSFDSVRIDGLDPGTTLCVDTVEVGQPVPGGELP
jgi:hypothetical protein